MTVSLISLTSVLLLSAALRILVSRNVTPNFDVYGHLCFAKALREQRRGPFGSVTLRFVGGSDYSQPFVWHWLVGFFNAEWLLRNQAWLNGAIDALFVAFAFFFAQWSGFGERIAFYAVAIYLLTPMWFSSIAIGPRIAGFTPRLSSELATNLFFMVCLFPVGFSQLHIVIVAGVLATFVLSSSKFGVQVMLFLTPLVSLIGGTLVPVISLLAGVALTFAVSRGKFVGQIKSQLTHLAWYFRENLKGKMHVSNRNSFRNLFRWSEPTLKANFIKFVYRAVSENSYTSVLIKLPVIVVVVFAIVQSIGSGNNSVDSFLAAPIVAACLIYFVVNLRPFLFLGEAERYLNHVAFFVALFAAKHMLGSGMESLLWVLLAYGAVYWAAETFALDKLKPRHLNERGVENDRVIEDLKSLTRPTVVLGYSYHAAGGVFRVIFETMHKTIYCLCTSKSFSERFNAVYASDYPYIKLEKLEEMADEYGIGYIVLGRREMIERGFQNWKPSTRWIKRPVGGDVYDVYYRREIGGEIGVVPSIG